MTADSLVSRWKELLGEPESEEGKTIQSDLLEALAEGILKEITENATITVAVGIPVSTAGTAAAQTGSTTGPGTATIE